MRPFEFQPLTFFVEFLDALVQGRILKLHHDWESQNSPDRNSMNSSKEMGPNSLLSLPLLWYFHKILIKSFFWGEITTMTTNNLITCSISKASTSTSIFLSNHLVVSFDILGTNSHWLHCLKNQLRTFFWWKASSVNSALMEFTIVLFGAVMERGGRVHAFSTAQVLPFLLLTSKIFQATGFC